MTFADVPLSARNILEEAELKSAVKTFRYGVCVCVFFHDFCLVVVSKYDRHC